MGWKGLVLFMMCKIFQLDENVGFMIFQYSKGMEPLENLNKALELTYSR